jgi:hypothetical protein
MVIYLVLPHLVSANPLEERDAAARKIQQAVRQYLNTKKLRASFPEPESHFIREEVAPSAVNQSRSFENILGKYRLFKFPLKVIPDYSYIFKATGISPYRYINYAGDIEEEPCDPPKGVFATDLNIILQSAEDVKIVIDKFGTFRDLPDDIIDKLQEAQKTRKPISMKDLLPLFAAHYIGKFDRTSKDKDGSNCRGAVLSFHDPERNVEYADVNPMMIKIENEGRELIPGETLSPGDIVTVWKSEKEFKEIDWERRKAGRDDRRGHLHSVIYLGRDYFFGKAGPSNLDPFGIQSFNDIFEDYISNFQNLHFTFHRLKPSHKH